MIRANNIAELFDFIKKNRQLSNLTLNISKKGIIGNPKNSTSLKGQKIVKITILVLEKIIKELKLL